MAVLLFAGDIDMQRARTLAEASFGDWTAEGPVPKVTLPSFPAPAATRIYLVDRPGVQCQIRAGRCLDLTRKDPDYFASLVVSGYFGGGFSSRLNETIRVKKGLTYGARGGYDAQREAGEFKISTFTKTARTAESVRAIEAEIDRLRAEPPSAEELDKTKSFTLGAFPRLHETPDQLASELWLIESCDLPKDYLQQQLRTVAATTDKDCERLIARTIDPSKLVIVVVGPAAELRQQLEPIAPVTVVTP
jgi:zinc protease